MTRRARAISLAGAALALLLSRQASAVYQCGDQKDDCQCGANNPYPCCDNGGNCTWWAWEASCCNWAVALPGWGNANQWAGNAKVHPDYDVLSSPVVGSIACRVTGTYGHVAWVTAVNGSSITVTEENCCSGCNYGLRTWNYQASYFDGGYIVRKAQCACTSGQTQSEGCGQCGTRTRACGPCNWNAWGDCTGQGPCAKGQTEEQSCGDCGKRSRTCNDACQWGDFGACAGPDPNGGQEPCETGQKGECASGLKRCVEGNLQCPPHKQPADEMCDKLDNDCDGVVDNGVCGIVGPPPVMDEGGAPRPDGASPDAPKASDAAASSEGGAGLFNRASENDGGCGCRVQPRGPRWAWLVAGLMAGLGLLRRRRAD